MPRVNFGKEAAMNTMRIATTARDTRGWIRGAGWAGVAGPVLFTATYVAQEAFRRDEYDPIAEPVSALEAGPNGWIQQANFVVFGLLTMLLAVGLHRGLPTVRRGIAGPAILLVSGIALLLAAVFPLREDAAGVTFDPGGHMVAGFLFFNSSAVALVVLSRRMARDERWHDLSTYTLIAGVVAIGCAVVMGTLVVPEDAPLHEWAGLGQRAVILLVLFPCRVILSARLLKVGTRAAGGSLDRA